MVVGEEEDDRLRSFCFHRELAEGEGSGVVRSGVSSGLYIAGARRFGGFQKTDTVAIAITPAGEVVGWPVRVGSGRWPAAVTPLASWLPREAPGSLDGAVHGIQWRRPLMADASGGEAGGVW